MAQLYRLSPVPLPAGTLEPGEYMLRDEQGVLMTISLRKPMSSRQLAAAISNPRERARLTA